MNRTLILNHRHIVQTVQRAGLHQFMSELIDRLENAFASYSSNKFDVPIRDGFRYDRPVPGLIEWMPLHDKGQAVFMKAVGYHPSNPIMECLPTVMSSYQLFDPRTGRLVAIADGNLLTAMRTGAASAVATKHLAARRSVSLGLVGCGAQAVTQFHAISRIADIDQVRVFDIDHRNARSLKHRLVPFNERGTRIRQTSLDELLEHSDVICTATSVEVGKGPVIDHQLLMPDVHLNAVGSDLPGKIELPVGLLKNSLVFPDHREQACIEGECQQLSEDEIGPTLPELVASPDFYHGARNQRTVFDSTGFALEDFVALQLLTDHATEFGYGEHVEIDGSVADPFNPYENIHSASESNHYKVITYPL
ncbi:MAG: ornithine cyclodeaminase family protein [Planctomycetales bacterium]|nr:ornithine cyclodeaminase family protein [Planctomycetales bacterium]